MVVWHRFWVLSPLYDVVVRQVLSEAWGIPLDRRPNHLPEEEWRLPPDAAPSWRRVESRDQPLFPVEPAGVSPKEVSPA
jgi:hypothetical protein